MMAPCSCQRSCGATGGASGANTKAPARTSRRGVWASGERSALHALEENAAEDSAAMMHRKVVVMRGSPTRSMGPAEAHPHAVSHTPYPGFHHISVCGGVHGSASPPPPISAQWAPAVPRKALTMCVECDGEVPGEGADTHAHTEGRNPTHVLVRGHREV